LGSKKKKILIQYRQSDIRLDLEEIADRVPGDRDQRDQNALPDTFIPKHLQAQNFNRFQ
jgi:hypothetical protein